MAAPILPYRSVLLTGGRGFVGRYLLPVLQARLAPEAIVHRLDRHGAEQDAVDLLDPVAVRALVARTRPELIVHLAAQSSVGQSAGQAADTWRVNVGGTVNLAEAVAAECPDATFAFSSSAEIYGSAFNGGRVDETTPPLPQSVYARTKRAAEEVLADTLRPENRLIIFRPTNHSGAGQDGRFVLPAFAEQIAAIEAGGRPGVIRVGSLTAERDFLDVRDVVNAYVGVLAQPGGDQRQTYNIASGHPVPIAHLLDHLLQLASVPITVEPDPARMRPSEVVRTEVASGRIRAQTGWVPHIALRDTVADVLEGCRRRAT
ncbi:NAD-dependent epimerase/dehydratase family protein [Sphingomonas hankookensis]